MRFLILGVEGLPSTEVWAVGLVLSGIVGLAVFLLRATFDDLKKTLAELQTGQAKMEKLINDVSVVLAQADGDKRVLEARIEARLDDCLRRVAQLEAEMREMSEGRGA